MVPENLIDRILEFGKRGPFFFHDLLEKFASVPYREILAAWGAVRDLVDFKRDEEGRYIYTSTERHSRF